MPQPSEEGEVQLRRQAVRMYRTGQPVDEIATALSRSRRWVYHWVSFQHGHPHTRFRSASRAPHHHPNEISRQLTWRIVQVRARLAHQRKPIGARTIYRELWKRRLKPCPSPRTIQRVLQRKGLTQAKAATAPGYRPHAPAEYPNAVQATDIVTRWLTGGAVVQTFTTVDHFTNAAYATSHPHKRIQAAHDHLLKTWGFLGLPDVAQFDNESAFSGGRHGQRLGPIIRLCLYVGCEVLFTPEYEADYNWEVETFNNFWAHQFWDKHLFTQRGRIPQALGRFLAWYDTDYVAPRQADTPHRLRRGQPLQYLSRRLARQIPDPLPLCKGSVHAIRCVANDGQVKFLQQTFLIGKRYAGKYVWSTLETAKQTLTVYYQAQADADWLTLRVFPYSLPERAQSVPKQFRRRHG